MLSLLNESKQNSINRRNFMKSLMGGVALAALAANKLNGAIYEKLISMGQQYLPHEAPDGVYWDYVAKQFMFEPDLIMMNNGTVGPMPRTVFNTLKKFFKIQATNPYEVYMTFYPYLDDTRQKVAKFINAFPDEIALTRNTTEGLNFVVNGLDMKPGDEVLMSNLEHPAGIQPWRLKEQRFGIKIKEVEIKSPPKSKDEILNAFNDAITLNTRIIHISHAVYLTGLITPIKELSQLARDRNVLIMVDGAHAFGMLDLDMHELGIDFYATSPYKWACAPIGSGVFYVRKEAQEALWPTIVTGGWDEVTGARKYDRLGQRAEPLVIALGEAIRFLSVIGKERIDRRIKTLATYLKQKASKIPGVKVYTPMEPYLSGGLTVLSLDGVKNDLLVNYLLEKHNLVIRTVFQEKNAVRISTPIWTSFKHVDMILEALKLLGAKK